MPRQHLVQKARKHVQAIIPIMRVKVRVRSVQDVLGMVHAVHLVLPHHVTQDIIYQVAHVPSAMKVIHRLMVMLEIAIRVIKVVLCLVIHKHVQKMQPVHTEKKLRLVHKIMVEPVMPLRRHAQLQLHVKPVII